MKEMDAIRLAEGILQGRTLFGEGLALLGNLMGFVGEKLRSCYHFPQETSTTN
jgi:hypothetical protein